MAESAPSPPRLYSSLAPWFHLLSPPSEYAEEAGLYTRHLLAAGTPPATTLIELGSGGGNNASHMKQHFRMTLTDVSPDMLAISRQLNPDCEHVLGDMRTLRLGREFDRVFIHDALCYMTTIEDLQRAAETAFVHCRPGGAALFAPDFVRENFRPSASHGGSDGATRGIRYLEWTWDPDTADSTYLVDYAFLLREDSRVRVEHDRHVEGLFARADWLQILAQTGFDAHGVAFEHSDVDYMIELFLGIKP